MPWGIAAAAITVGGGMMAADKQAGAAKDAAAQQQASAAAQMGLDANVFNAQAAMNLPTRELGGEAQNRLAYLFGLDPNLNIAPDFSTPNINANPGTGPGLTWSGQSSGYAWNNTGSGNPNAPTLQPNTYNGVNPVLGTNSAGPQSGMYTPPAGGGPSATPGASLGGFGSFANPYNPATFFQDPGYAFIKQQNEDALARSGAASGQVGAGATNGFGGASGAQLKEALKYSSGLASQEFNNAFTRSLNTQTTTFNELSALAGGGQVATSQVGDAAGQFGRAGSSALAQYGNAGAAGTIGAGNAVAGGITNATNGLGSLYTQYQNGNISNPFASNNLGYTPAGGGTVNSPYINQPQTGLDNWNTQQMPFVTPTTS